MTNLDTETIAELAEVNPAVDLGALSADSMVSFIPMSDVTETGQWVNLQERKFDEIRAGYRPFAEGDLLFAKITPCMENGKGAHAIGLTNGVGFGSTEFHVLRARAGNSARFLFHWLQSQSTRTRAIAYMGGSAGQQRVQAGFFTHYRVKAIEPPEQSQIAWVLDTADAAIAKTGKVIAKLRQVRSGLLHDLLTRGLDKNGELRDPIRHPEEFQNAPFGCIPKVWDVIRIRDEVDILHGYAFHGRYFSDKPVGPRLLVPGNFHRDGGLYFTDDNTKYYGGTFPQDTVLTKGEMLIVMTDLSPMTLILGRTVLLNESFPVLHNQRIGKFRLKQPADWNPAFVVAMMNDDRVRRKIIREATGTTVRHTSPDRIKSGFAFKPKREEQDQIVAKLDDTEAAIIEFEAERAKLSWLKSGLMNDLLTGRVRVPQSIGASK